LMGLVIIGVEGGYMLMYKKGWEVSKGSLIANICVAVTLLFIGIALFHEKMNLKKIIGLIVCIIGIVLISIE
ncbi:MAG: EamA family transporter, partial [Lachnospiraceae bacterium]|nr:EamA family transporter [Lachnospiraceae bacterium]